MKKEIITGKCIHVMVSGENEKKINEALEESFKTVLSEIRKGRSYRLKPKNIGSTRLTFGIEEFARFE